MRIMIETTAPLSETDHRILSMILDRHEAVAAEPTEPTEKAEPAKKAEAEPKPEPKPEPEPEGEKDEGDQDSPVSDETMDTAVSKAKALMQDGKKAKVKSALEAAGVPRVGAIETEGQALRFIDALEA